MDDTELTYGITVGTDITATLDIDTITFDAPDDYNGSENFTITVSDGELTDSQVITVTINAVNDNPIATTGITGTTPEGASVSIALSGSDVDGDVLTYSTADDAENGSVVVSGSYATYMPDDYFNGPDTFTFTVSDGELSDDATITVTVTEVNDPPVLATLSDVSFDEGGSGTVSLSATDVADTELTDSIKDETDIASVISP